MAANNSVLDAADIANAALLEVGDEPCVVWATDPLTGLDALWGPPTSNSRRARILGRIAAGQGSALVRCSFCIDYWETRLPCVTFIEAMRGLTCGGTS